VAYSRVHGTWNIQFQHGVRFTSGTRTENRWDEVTRAHIITTSDGRWGEDIFFVLEGTEGKGCVVPHDAAVRTKLLREMQTRFEGIDNRKVIEAMGSTSRTTFIIWEKPAASNERPSEP
jgi:hypothetical protein